MARLGTVELVGALLCDGELDGRLLLRLGVNREGVRFSAVADPARGRYIGGHGGTETLAALSAEQLKDGREGAQQAQGNQYQRGRKDLSEVDLSLPPRQVQR